MPWTQLGPASEPAPPADRGDAAQPDPAVIERATEAFEAWMDEHDDVPGAMRAAAPMIRAATAEQIAVEFENWSETATWLTSDTCRAVANMIRSLDFGAGLSAGATGGDGDE